MPSVTQKIEICRGGPGQDHRQTKAGKHMAVFVLGRIQNNP